MPNNLDAVLNSVRAMPIGADLVLKENANHEAIICDGELLARVVVEAAHRFNTGLAVPVMDLTLEKHAICSLLGVAPQDEGSFHLTEPLPEGEVARLIKAFDPMDFEHMRANIEAVAAVARMSRAEGVVATGMSIGPFSLMSKLLRDPITPVYLAGSGLDDSDDPSIALLEQALELSVAITLKYIDAQLEAGAELIVIAEPAANRVYISPKQLETGSDVFERFVMRNLQLVNDLIVRKGAQLFFHCCGELTPGMVRSFASLKPAVLSLGSSRHLWEDASLVGKGTVLFGNLPSKRFYSDSEMSVHDVYAASLDLLARMSETGHPFILGTECDVLSVPGCEATIMAKVAAMCQAAHDFDAGVAGPHGSTTDAQTAAAPGAEAADRIAV